MNSQTEDSFSEFQKEYACFLEEMSGKEKDGDPPRTSASRESTKRSSNSPASNSQQEAEVVQNQILLSNFPESNGDYKDRKIKDLKRVNKMLKSIVDSFHVERVCRLGDFDESRESPRKLLIHLANESEQQIILQNSAKLKKLTKWKSVSMKVYHLKQKEKSKVKEEPTKEKRKALSSKYSKKVNVETRSESESSDVSSEESTDERTESNPFRLFDSISPPVVKRERNIILIGETGVGKSTFINGIANYMKYDSFDDALQEKRPACLIPMFFNWPTGDTVDMKPTIALQPDGNEEDARTGQSCTQAPKVYRFVTDMVAFNLIDTPGIGDTKGVEFDMENMRSVVKCAASCETIHGICLLLKPNVNRLGLSLRYTITELLANLHQNALPNIVVVFTNSRSTFHQPGGTMVGLKQLFEEVKETSGNKIPLTSKNVFCVDNEAIRFLYAHHKGVSIEQSFLKKFSETWKHTVCETHRLFNWVANLSSHLANETRVTSVVRGSTNELCRILVEIIDLKKRAQKRLVQQKRHATYLEEKLVEFEATHTISDDYFVETPQTTRDMVCWGKDCIEQLIDPSTNTNKTFHKLVCLQNCPLPNVKENQPGDPALRQSPIFGSDGLCTTCKCSWQIHGHISYSQEKKTGIVQLTDSKTAADRALLSDELACNAELIIETEQKLNDLTENYPKVQVLAKPYADFLEANSIVPLNKNFEKYVELCIGELEKMLKPDDRSKIERLEKLIVLHQQQQLLDSVEASGEKITFGNYSRKILQLKNDPIVGDALRNSDAYQKLLEIPRFNFIEVKPRGKK